MRYDHRLPAECARLRKARELVVGVSEQLLDIGREEYAADLLYAAVKLEYVRLELLDVLLKPPPSRQGLPESPAAPMSDTAGIRNLQ